MLIQKMPGIADRQHYSLCNAAAAIVVCFTVHCDIQDKNVHLTANTLCLGTASNLLRMI
jgi:hypothetical protein